MRGGLRIKSMPGPRSGCNDEQEAAARCYRRLLACGCVAGAFGRCASCGLPGGFWSYLNATRRPTIAVFCRTRRIYHRWSRCCSRYSGKTTTAKAAMNAYPTSFPSWRANTNERKTAKIIIKRGTGWAGLCLHIPGRSGNSGAGAGRAIRPG